MISRSTVRRLAVSALAVGGTAGLFAAASGPAVAAGTLPPNLAKYANCPISDPTVASCVYIETSSAQLKVGKFDLRTNDPIKLEFGLKNPPPTYEDAAVAPNNGHKVMTAPPIEVPGGIFGVPGAGVGPLAAYVTPELTEVPRVNTNNLVNQEGVALGLKVKAKVHNPFTDVLSIFGPGCYIGSNTWPIPLDLTTGTTNPPLPNKPISGAYNPGTPEGWGIKFDDVRAVDNAFAAPGASGCGTPFGWMNPIVNGIAGVPSKAGTNTAVLVADISITDANEVREALGLDPVYQ